MTEEKSAKKELPKWVSIPTICATLLAAGMCITHVIKTTSAARQLRERRIEEALHRDPYIQQKKAFCARSDLSKYAVFVIDELGEGSRPAQENALSAVVDYGSGRIPIFFKLTGLFQN